MASPATIDSKIDRPKGSFCAVEINTDEFALISFKFLGSTYPPVSGFLSPQLIL
jgi:hypothetical protein